nr:aspartate kinase [Gemmatimonadaceae bacterium]
MPSVNRAVVHKFGGAALADADAIGNVGALLIAANATRCVVVTSALQGVTEQLLAAIEYARKGDDAGTERVVRELRDRHLSTAAAVAPEDWTLRETLEQAHDELASMLGAVVQGTTAPDARSDRVLAHGEQVASRLVAAMLTARGRHAVAADATCFLVTDGRHGDAAPDLDRTERAAYAALEPLLDAGIVVIVPGFIGASPTGAVTTLGRGGSDLTATVLARSLGAREVTLWKDVRGLMTADPRLVPEARVVKTLDPREASELAYFGAKILHPRTLTPLRAGTTLHLRPFATPAETGTSIIAGRAAKGRPVRAIAGITGQALITVSGTGMLGVPGVASRVFGVLAGMGVSVSMISQASSEQSICFTIPGTRAGEVWHRLRDAFAEELARREVDDVCVQDELTTIAVVGSGMARTPGVSARIFAAVSEAGVSVVAIAQGASERNVSFVVESAFAASAVRAVHAAFRLDKVGGGRTPQRDAPRDVVLLGAGRVARELMAQIAALTLPVDGPRVRIVGIVDRSGSLFKPRGFTPRELHAIAMRKQGGMALSGMTDGRPGNAAAAVEHIATHALSRPILVDLASGETGAALLGALSHGFDLVLANKVPLAGALSQAQEIVRGSRDDGRRVLHEATVGAGLPVIDTVQQLIASGDRVETIDCSPSGTMGYLFSEMGRGRRFSDAVREAMALGYTEPDPRDDLCGLDVARKGLILSRMLGYTGEMKDVGVESLVPSELRDVSRDEFLAALPTLDDEWGARVRSADARGEAVRYRVRATRRGVRVGLACVPRSSALASLDGTDNLFVFTTARYRDRPLVVSGPGAGAAVTAAGVL